MDAKRTSEQIDKELQELRGKIRALESDRQERQKAVERAKKQRTERAFAAHAENDKGAQEALGRARESQVKAALELEDLESAIAEGRRRFKQLEREWRAALREESWQATLKLGAECLKEADQLDNHIQGLAKILAPHQAKLEELRRMAVAAGRPLAFRNAGLRFFFRCFHWAVLPFAPLEVEKPSEQFRHGYAAVVQSMIEAAKTAPDENPEPEQPEGDGLDHEPSPDPETQDGVKAGAMA